MAHHQQNMLLSHPPPAHMTHVHEHVTELVTKFETELPMRRIDAHHAFTGYLDSEFQINDCGEICVPRLWGVMHAVWGLGGLANSVRLVSGGMWHGPILATDAK